MLKTFLGCSGRMLGTITFLVTLIQSACGGGLIGDPMVAVPVLTLQLPEVIPEPGSPDYDILIRFADHHDNIYAFVSGGSSQILDRKIRVNFAAGERGTANIAIYPHPRNGCAQYVATASTSIDRDGILPTLQISSFTRQAMETCLLDVDHQEKSGNRVGKVVSSAVPGSADPQISCGTECFAHVPKGHTVDLQATGTQVFLFSYWEIASAAVTMPIVINGPTAIVARFSSMACNPGAYCQDDLPKDDLDISKLTIRDLFGTSKDEVWAVGATTSNGGVVLRYSGRQWQAVSTDSAMAPLPALRGVWGDASSGRVWVAGADSNGGALLSCKADLAGKPQCQTEKWTIGGDEPTPAPSLTGITGFGNSLWLMDVRAVYGSSKWTVGGTNDFTMLGPNNGIISMAAQSATSVAVVGQGGIAYTCGTGTSCMELRGICGSGSPSVPSYFAVASNGTQLLAGGDGGNLCRYTGGGWLSELPNAASSVIVRDVALAGTRAWAVGSAGYVESWPFGDRTGKVQMPMKATSADLYAVWSAGSDTWFGGRGVLLHYQ